MKDQLEAVHWEALRELEALLPYHPPLRHDLSLLDQMREEMLTDHATTLGDWYNLISTTEEVVSIGRVMKVLDEEGCRA